MIKDSTRDSLLDLLRLELGAGQGTVVPGETSSEAADFKFWERCEAADWDEVLQFGARQGVASIVFDQLESLYEVATQEQRSLLPGKEVSLKWFAHTRKTEQQYLRQREAIRSLAAFYANQGIRMLVFKGYALSHLYAVPEDRVGGDVDIWLFGDGERADASLSELGVAVRLDEDKHSAFDWKGVHFENHACFVGVRGADAAMQSFEALLERTAGESCIPDEDIPNVYFPSATFNALFLPYHLANHWTRNEASLRQLCDWAIFLKKCATDVDWSLVCENAEKTHFTRFLAALNELAARLFDLDRDTLPQRGADALASDTKLADTLLDDIIYPEKVIAIPTGAGFLRTSFLKAIRFWQLRGRRRVISRQGFLRAFYWRTLSYLRIRTKFDKRSIWKMRHVKKKGE